MVLLKNEGDLAAADVTRPAVIGRLADTANTGTAAPATPTRLR